MINKNHKYYKLFYVSESEYWEELISVFDDLIPFLKEKKEYSVLEKILYSYCVRNLICEKKLNPDFDFNDNFNKFNECYKKQSISDELSFDNFSDSYHKVIGYLN